MNQILVRFAVTLALIAPAWAAQPLPAVDLPKIEPADIGPADAWGAVQQDGTTSFRCLRKGQTGRVHVPAWWDANALRPAEGTHYVLEVTFQDTVKVPVVFLTHGGNGTYYAPAEVHRFGGDGDGRWKTVRLPFGWDQIIRQLHLDPAQERFDRTGFSFLAADADLPIAALAVKPATAADEAAYNAETRAWVARVQAGLRQANPPKLEPRRFKLADATQPVVAFPWPSMLPLLPEAQPRDEQIGATLKLRTCIGMLEAGSFGVYANGAELTNLDYTVSALTDAAGNAFAGSIVRRTAEYGIVPVAKVPRLIPQRLWPAYATTVAKGQSQWLWFNVQTVRNQTRPGTYRGTVTVTSDQGKVTLPVELEVLPIDLPTMDECGFVAGGCMKNMVPVHDIAFQAGYNANAVSFFYPSAPTPMTGKEGKLRIDFRYLDDWYPRAKQRGCKAVVYFCGGDPYSWPESLHVQRDFSRMDRSGEAERASRIAWGKAQNAAPERVLPEVRLMFQEWIRQVHGQALKNNWPEMIFSPFDEPAKWTQDRRNENALGTVIGAGPHLKPFFKDCAAAIHEVDPAIRVYGSIHHNVHKGQSGIGECFIPDVDVFCANCIHEDPTLGDKVRAGGKTFWQYTGAGAGSSPDRGRYSFGFYFGTFDARGGLVWAYNMAGFDTSGSGEQAVYAWQTPFDTIPGPWFEGYRAGWDDRRIIEAFKKRFAGNAAKLQILHGIFDEVRQEMAAGQQQGGRDTVSDFWNAIADSGRLDAWRNRLLDAMVQAP